MRFLRVRRRFRAILACALMVALQHSTDALLAASDAPPEIALTNREREVLHLVAAGNTNQAIAHKLGISIKTVQTHREHIMAKLDLRDITHLVRYAIRHGIISTDA